MVDGCAGRGHKGDGMPEVTLSNAGDGSVSVLLNSTSPGDTTLNLTP